MTHKSLGQIFKMTLIPLKENSLFGNISDDFFSH